MEIANYPFSSFSSFSLFSYSSSSCSFHPPFLRNSSNSGSSSHSNSIVTVTVIVVVVTVAVVVILIILIILPFVYYFQMYHLTWFLVIYVFFPYRYWKRGERKNNHRNIFNISLFRHILTVKVTSYIRRAGKMKLRHNPD